MDQADANEVHHPLRGPGARHDRGPLRCIVIGPAAEQRSSVALVNHLEVEHSFVQSFSLIGQMNPVSDGSAADGTTITCRITVDGEVIAEQTSTGQYAAVTCAGSEQGILG